MTKGRTITAGDRAAIEVFRDELREVFAAKKQGRFNEAHDRECKPMKASQLVESKWLFAAGFGQNGVPFEPTVTIEKVAREKVDKEMWGVLYFREEWTKPYKVNRTAQKALIAMFGDETDHWLGKRLTLFALPGTYFGEPGVAVRIKGSPDLKAPVSFTVRKGKGRELQTHNLVVTGGTAQPRASAAAAPAAATAPTAPTTAPAVAPRAATPAAPAPTDGGRAFTFGPHKGKPIASADASALLETISTGEAKIAAEPRASWVPGVEQWIAYFRTELEKRAVANLATEAPREPGSDDGDPGSPPPS